MRESLGPAAKSIEGNLKVLTAADHEVFEVPKKKASGGAGASGSTKRKRKYGQQRSENPDFKKSKWGTNVKKGIQNNNERRERQSGRRVRRRPAAAA